MSFWPRWVTTKPNLRASELLLLTMSNARSDSFRHSRPWEAQARIPLEGSTSTITDPLTRLNAALSGRYTIISFTGSVRRR
jgi:hypothetical protein